MTIFLKHSPGYFFRADCFSTKFFYECMEVLLVEDDVKQQVAKYLEDAHTSTNDDYLSKK